MDGGQFDSEALWRQVHGQIVPGAKVLIVRGDTRDEAPVSDRSDDPAAKLQGVRGVGRDWLAQRLQQAGARVDFVVAYQRCAPVWGDAERVLATHARIVQAALGLGFAQVRESRPTLEAVRASIESFV